MIKNQKRKAIISSVVILLPILFGLAVWDQLPATMVSHWGGDGVADGSAPKAFMVFGMPMLLLVFHWLMLWVTTVVDKKNAQNSKMIAVCYSIIPALSLTVHAVVYSIALEKDWNVTALIPLLIGAMLLFIGNYMPKTTRNRTAGIKLRWTMGNDENWNKTHRLGGRIYFWGGLLILVSALFPAKFTIAMMILVLATSIAVPTAYSYALYKKHKAAGVEYEPVFNTKSDKIAVIITMVLVPLILIGVGVLMFTGDISVTYNETDFRINASYMDDITVRYEDVESIEYRESVDVGFREYGYGSPRLSMGTFKNEEFGRYTLYAYTAGAGGVVLKQGDRVLVLVGKTAEDTKTIYDNLAERIK